jgi:hypothetical protein
MSRSTLLLAALTLLSAGCGQTGDLVLPDRQPPPKAAAPAPAAAASNPEADADTQKKKDGTTP